jgi:hypothetical protein
MALSSSPGCWSPEGSTSAMAPPERSWHPEAPLLLTRTQAAKLCQVSEEILDQWSYEPGFPVIRRDGGHFVRIHRAALERWLESFALPTNAPARTVRDDPPASPRRQRRAADG